MRQIIWLALGYNVPANPSKNRVYVWRKLKEYGAGYFKQGVAVLPKNQQSLEQFAVLTAKIRDLGGEATLAELKFCDIRDEIRMVDWFEAQSTREYTELVRDCAEVMSRLRDSVIPGEKEDYMRKISKHYSKVRSRDYFKIRKRREVVQNLEELFGDMANVTDDLKRQLSKAFTEKD